VYIIQRNNVKIISAIPGTSSMDKEEVNKFLESKILLQIGTIDEEGDPNIHPVWFSYDKDREKLLVITPKITKKVKNLRSKPNVYFSVDDVNITYKGVKGKGTATIIEDPKRTVSYGEKIYMKYLGTLDHPVSKMILDSAKKGNHVVLEISPKFFSTWDFPKV
jgi:nitroimidazol reductase NimA-like FMN-containing flavoprotein (pyridoxamine 5'-phosphate oxidase superfamily)